MTKFQGSILKFLYFCSLAKCVISYNANFFDIQQIRNEILLLKNDFDLSKALIQSMPYDWIENRDCFVELNAIENGVRNFDEWAIKSK